MTLEIRLLGPLEVRVHGRPVPLGGHKQRSLLTLLVLHANSVVSSDRLVDEIWGRTPVDAATRSLRVYTSNLRKALGEASSRLQTRGGGYSLAVEPAEVDAGRFEQLVGRARRLRAAGGDERAAATLREALALWRGPPLADVRYESFAQAEVDRLDELRLAVVEELVDADLALGRHAELIAELEALARQHPLRERLRGNLMLALYRSGRQHDALEAYDDLRRVLRDEHGLDPTSELRELQAAILRQDADLVVEPAHLRVRRHLPAPTTPLVGRQQEIDDIRSLLLDDGARLVTLTGPGGIGKTRLGLRTAHELVASFADGVYFVDLAPVRDTDQVVSTIATALGIGETAGRSLLDVLQHQLADRHLLLLVDNFEQVDEAAPLLSTLLTGAAHLRIVVTSRSRLRLYGEHEYRVRELAPPDAIELFDVRARAVDQSFRLGDVNRPMVAELCERLDGLPLAIELAAARAGELALDRMLGELPLALAGAGPRDVPARQQTLRSAIAWSYDLLAPAAQRLFRRLAVFVGGCTESAARDVCGAGREELDALVRANLLGRADVRYSMLETIRSYAVELLDATDERGSLHLRHAGYFAALAESLQPLREERLDVVETEHDNLRAALTFAEESSMPEIQLRVCGAIWRFWYVRGLLSDGVAQLDRALAVDTGELAGLRAGVLRGASVLTWAQADYDAAHDFAQRSLDIFEALGDEVGMTRALISLGLAAQSSGELGTARTLHEQCRSLAERLGMSSELAAALANLGDIALIEGDLGRARTQYQASLDLCRSVDDLEGGAIALMYLGAVDLATGDLRSAGVSFAESLRQFELLRFTERMSSCLTGLAATVVDEDPAGAARLLGAASALREKTLTQPEAWWEQPALDRTLEAARAQLGDDGFAAAFEDGAVEREPE